jgi:hypothetical protein
VTAITLKADAPVVGAITAATADQLLVGSG